MSVKLIAHVLIECQGKILVIQRTAIKRGEKNVFPNFWDVPGGRVESGELPRQAAIRECYEETGILLDIDGLTICHEDSQYDVEKSTVFTRLVYRYHLETDRLSEVRLDGEEHQEFCWVSSLDELTGKDLVPYLKQILIKEKLCYL